MATTRCAILQYCVFSFKALSLDTYEYSYEYIPTEGCATRTKLTRTYCSSSLCEQVFVDQVNSDVVAVTRHCPTKRESYILVARTSFRPADEYPESIRIPNLHIPGIPIVLKATVLIRTTMHCGHILTPLFPCSINRRTLQVYIMLTQDKSRRWRSRRWP